MKVETKCIYASHDPVLAWGAGSKDATVDFDESIKFV
mgnify:CR=1 FL=1